jgi:protein dithiol oxidoreductase (disulfide-forming)
MALAAGGPLFSGFPRTPAAQDERPRARLNVDYRLVAPQAVSAGDAVEVLEFFWYGCPYCAQLQPHFTRWEARKPADVVVRKVPAVFRESWLPHARMYYALEALGELDRLHQEVYRSYHVGRVPLNTMEAIADWAAQQGIERERWLAAYRSEDVDRKVTQARRELQRYAVAGTPTLVVDGRYLTSSGMTPGVAALIPILDDLVVLAREQRAGR